MNSPSVRSWRVYFVWSFAWRDLSESAAWPVSRVMIWTIALTTAGGAISVTLPIATNRVTLNRLQANPMARCVWARDRMGARRFEKADLDRLDGQLRASLPRPEHLSGCYPFTEISFQWHFASDPGSEGYRGRSLAPADPLFRSLYQQKFLQPGGAPFNAPDQPGVIVTPRLLENLGYPADTKAGTLLKVNSPNSGVPVEIPIVGITRDALPLSHYFIINDLEYVRLLMTDPDQSSDSIETGDLGPGWPERPRDFEEKLKRPEVRETLDKWGWQGFSRTHDGKPCYRLQLTYDGTMRRSLWKGYLEQLHDIIVRAGLPRHDEFVAVRMREAALKEPPKLPPPEWVGVYVADLVALEPTVASLKQDRWLTNEIAVAQMKEISRSFYITWLALLGLMFLFCAAAAVSFYTAHSLRAKQKSAQIGMMRAIGMSDRLLLGIFLIEAFMLWWRGTLLGLILALAIVAGPACLFLEPDEFSFVLRDVQSASAIAAFLLASLLGTGFTAWLSTRKVRSQPPISSLALTS